MRAPDFWWRTRPGFNARLFSPIAAIWGTVAARRMRRSRPRAQAPALCVGNFVVGGAGKTPVVALVSEILDQWGLSPVVLSRGYGGSLAGKTPVIVDPRRHGAGEVGDEPLLLSQKTRVVIGTDRHATAAAACALGARALILDDGFQSTSLEADASLIVADAQMGLGNGCVLPAGPLRAPLSTQWKFASALLLLGEGEPGRQLAEDARSRGIPVFRALVKPDPGAARELSGRTVLAFAGIGSPQKFYATLTQVGVRIVRSRSYADHHPYTQSDMVRLSRAAEAAGAERLVTTEKDIVRILGPGGPGAMGLPIAALPVSVRLAEDAAFRAWLSEALKVSASPPTSP